MSHIFRKVWILKTVHFLIILFSILVSVILLRSADSQNLFSYTKNVKSEKISYFGFFAINDHAFQSVEINNKFHFLSYPIALEKNKFYRIKFDVINTSQERILLTTDFFGPGYDNAEQEHAEIIELGSSSVNCLFNSGDAPNNALLRIMYSGKMGMQIKNIQITKIHGWQILLVRSLYLLLAIASAITFKSLVYYVHHEYGVFFSNIKGWKVNARLLDICILFLGALGSGYVAIWFGQDMNWDMLNYHYYNAYSFVNSRFLLDIAPAGIQTYLNPIGYLPFYFLATTFTPLYTTFLLGSLNGVNFWLVYKISLHFITKFRVITASIISFLAFFVPSIVLEIGSSYNDLVISSFVLSGILLILNTLNNNLKYLTFNLILSGFSFGFAIGLKLTALIYLASVMFCLIYLFSRLELSFSKCIKILSLFTSGVFAGLIVSAGYWFFLLYEKFGNPLFPFFNGFFKSQYFPYFNFRDAREIPNRVVDLIFYPFYFNLSSSSTSRELGMVILETLFFIFVPLVLFVGKSNIFKTLDLKVAFVSLFFLIAYLLWLPFFAIPRYFIPAQLLVPLLIYILLNLSLKLTRATPLLFGILTAILFTILIVGMKLPSYSQKLINFNQNSYFKIDIPLDIKEAKNCIFIAISSGDPISYIIPSLPPSCRVLRIGNGEWVWTKKLFGSNTKFSNEILTILNKFNDSLYLLIDELSLKNAQNTLDTYHLKLVESSKVKITTEAYIFELKKTN